MLHTVNKSPFEKNALQSCLEHTQADSSILMFEDGVYGAMQGTKVAAAVEKAAASCKIYVLGPDLAARGMNEDKIISGIQVVDYGGFVDLVAENSTVQAWL